MKTEILKCVSYVSLKYFFDSVAASNQHRYDVLSIHRMLEASP